MTKLAHIVSYIYMYLDPARFTHSSVAVLSEKTGMSGTPGTRVCAVGEFTRY